MATGVPNPAAPSINAPKQKAISKSCKRRSGVMPATECFMISNCPVATVMSYRNTAATTIHTIFSSPYAMPYPKLVSARLAGILNTNIAHSTAVAAPAIAHKCACTLNPASSPSSTITGSAAISVDNHQWPSGSYACVQVTGSPPISCLSKLRLNPRGGNTPPAAANATLNVHAITSILRVLRYFVSANLSSS